MTTTLQESAHCAVRDLLGGVLRSGGVNGNPFQNSCINPPTDCQKRYTEHHNNYNCTLISINVINPQKETDELIFWNDWG